LAVQIKVLPFYKEATKIKEFAQFVLAFKKLMTTRRGGQGGGSHIRIEMKGDN